MTDKQPLPFSYVAHKDGLWASIISPGFFTKRELHQWIGENVADGWEIAQPATQAEHKALMATLEPAGGERAKEKQGVLL
jgi:hypothetical protein